MSGTVLASPVTPTLRGGGPLRTYGLVRALARHGPVDVVYQRFGEPAPAPAYDTIDGVTLHGVDPSKGPRRALAVARARLRGVPPDFARGVSAELARAVARIAEQREPDRIVAAHPVAAAALLGLARRRPVVYSAENVESDFRDVGAGRDALRRFERLLMETMSETWMVSHRDVELARAIAPSAVIRYVPNVVDVAAIEPVATPPGDRRALFVGDLTYAPNRDGLRFLVDEVMPRVWQGLPEARLAVVGRGLDAPLSGDERIEWRGFVDDLPAEYHRADAVVVPLLSGGGTPLKFVEALAYGLPVVATPKAAAGLELEADRDFREAEGAEAFAAALEEVLRHGDPQLGARGRAVAEERYSIEALARELAA